MQLTTHRRLRYITLLLATIAAGLLWRFAPLHLPALAFKYGGSALWAMAIYWLFAATLPRTSPLLLGLLAALLSAALEFSRLVHIPALDAFRLTLPGKLLLGRIFSLRNIVAYWLAILAASLIDRLALQTPQPHPRSNR